MKIKNAVVACTCALAIGNAQAALFDRGGGLIYDDVLNITWLQDANYAKTSGYDADGIMDWYSATSWAASLTYHDYVRGTTYDDWRLPSVRPVNGTQFNYSFDYSGNTDQGFNIVSQQSEFSYMFYVNFGNKGLRDTQGNYPSGEGLQDDPTNMNDESLFLGIGSAFWSGSTYFGPDVSTVPFAFDFVMGGGAQSRAFKFGADHSAWAVRDGDVAAPIPEPETYALMLAGLGLMGVVSRRWKYLVTA